MKRSVSAPGWRKNWRRRWLVLLEDGICWHRDEGLFNPVGELRFEPGATMRRVDADGSMLSIACAGRELVLMGSAPEVPAQTLNKSGNHTLNARVSFLNIEFGAGGTSKKIKKIATTRTCTKH